MLDSLVPGATPDSAVFESVNTLPLLLVLRVRAHIKPFLVVPAIHAEPMHFVLLKLPLVNGIVEHQRAKSMQISPPDPSFLLTNPLSPHRFSTDSPHCDTPQLSPHNNRSLIGFLGGAGSLLLPSVNLEPKRLRMAMVRMVTMMVVMMRKCDSDGLRVCIISNSCRLEKVIIH